MMEDQEQMKKLSFKKEHICDIEMLVWGCERRVNRRALSNFVLENSLIIFLKPHRNT